MNFLIRKILNRPEPIKTYKGFFDYSAGERKKIIKKASKEAIKEQKSLMKKYKVSFLSN